MREAVIAGVADAALKDGRLLEPSNPLGAQARVARAALADAGFGFEDVDGLLTAGLWGVPGPGILPTVTLAEYLGVRPRFSDATNIGGSSFQAHVAHAAMAIEAGYCDVALITYGSTQRSDRSRSLQGRPSVLTMQYETPWGLPTPVGGYALAAMRHMYEYGTTGEQLAEVAVAARRWAQLNPGATRREDLSVEDVLSSPMISDPLHLLDCCLVTDGAGAIVMTSSDNLSHSDRPPVFLRGYGESQSHWTVASMPDLVKSPAAVAGQDALSRAGVGLEDIDVVGIYDSFTITVLMTLEALGFCEPGEAGEFIADRGIGPDGSFPMNTNGGGLSSAHPGMYGIFLIIEAVRQLRNECDARQVPGATLALVNGTGGTLSSAATCILSV